MSHCVPSWTRRPMLVAILATAKMSVKSKAYFQRAQGMPSKLALKCVGSPHSLRSQNLLSTTLLSGISAGWTLCLCSAGGTMVANCISLRQVPSCALLGLGQEYRCLLRNACLAQLYRQPLSQWTGRCIWALYLLFPLSRLQISQQPNQECGVPAAPAGLCCPSEKGRISQGQRQTGHQEAKKYVSHSVRPEPSSAAVSWSKRSRADRVKNRSKF